MDFTEDWFSSNIPNFAECMANTPEKKLFLEIGVFEGRSTCWLLENGLADKGSIVCVDTFNGGQEHGGINFKAVEARFWSNTSQTRKNTQVVSAFKKPSYEALAEMIGHKYVFDFIYIDGSHTAYDTLSDACMAWGMLKSGGVMLFDDYEWNKHPELVLNPKLGIEAFLGVYAGQYEILFRNYQLAVKKK
jgi:predicted O-methyltransferase YrrM